ncbi:MAG: 2,3,4,5-tetrahydropyridine-2,6-dicarboxylate N-succinyltransferase [Proteobacteria bacterium]|nr:2,3,4,5-tetrahydropyridine-2,6-dicarboxylate N-succinyltransferase [Pseudomonadota bacterium]
MSPLKYLVETAWENKNTPHPGLPEALQEIILDLDRGALRVCEKQNGTWHTQAWLKKALLLSFPLTPTRLMTFPMTGYDKIPSKFEGWDEATFEKADFRVVPGALVRRGTYVAPKCILMPSFTNFGAYIDEGTLIDMGAAIGSCAQIGKKCHISAGAMIGGVVEPVQASPVIIEDHVFVGASACLVEGVVVEEGAVIGMGTKMGASTPLVERATGRVTYGRVPAYAVVVPGTMAGDSGVALQCAVLIKQVDEKTRHKTAINDLLRL